MAVGFGDLEKGDRFIVDTPSMREREMTVAERSDGPLRDTSKYEVLESLAAEGPEGGEYLFERLENRPTRVVMNGGSERVDFISGRFIER